MKPVNNTNYGRQLNTLGYELFMYGRDIFGNSARYVTSPISGSGPVSCFDNLKQVWRYVLQVSLNRDMEEMTDAEWLDRNYTLGVSRGGPDYL